MAVFMNQYEFCILKNPRIVLVFFKKLAMSFSNLKELHLYKVRMSDSADYFRDILIELDDLYLEILSLTTVKWLDSEQTPEEELVCVEMKGRRQYVKVCTGEIPKTITNEEGAALWEYFPGKYKYLIVWNAPARFELNNVYIELMI